MRFTGNVSLNVAVVSAVLFAGIAAFVSVNTSEMMAREAERTVRSVVKTTATRIDCVLSGVEAAVHNSAWVVGEHLASPDDMYRITRELVTNNDFIVGSTVAFTPDFFPARGRYFAPFTCQYPDGRMESFQLGSDTNVYFTQEWFAVPCAKKSAVWCEPYFDTGGSRILMSTYSVPVKDAHGDVYAILTADISLRRLTDLVAAIRPYPQSYAVLTSEKGAYLVAPPQTDESARNRTMTIRDRTQNGWTVEVICPLAPIVRDARRLVLQIALFSLAGLGFITFLAWFFSSRLQRATAQRERMESELAIGSRIQSGILPQGEHECLSGLIRPARQISGDLYDFQERGGKLYFIVGDASGKGLPASLFSFMAVTAFRLACNLGLPPSEIVRRINAVLAKGNDMCMFVTAFVGVLDRATGVLEYCNAGHNPPLLAPPSVAPRLLDVRRNVPMGVMEGCLYAAQSMALEKGTRLYVYTDGVTEAERIDHAQFGVERLSAFAVAHAKDEVRSLAPSLLAAVDAYTEEAPQFDDITVLVLER